MEYMDFFFFYQIDDMFGKPAYTECCVSNDSPFEN